ncbi:MAG: hypothetical protein M3Q82_01490 [Actinomycetota bacterium]|nr:hypothetical protein [Actinomycetota bacterium]
MSEGSMAQLKPTSDTVLLYAALLDDPTMEFPVVVLLVSGGHTMLVTKAGRAARQAGAKCASTTRP